jgi:hypothetical protein
MACLLKDKERVEFSKSPTSWKIILEHMTNNVISKVDALMYNVFNNTEKHMLYGASDGTTKHNVTNEVSHKPRSLQLRSTLFGHKFPQSWL